MKIEIEVGEFSEAWEPTSEFRPVKEGDPYLDEEGNVMIARHSDCDARYVIMRRTDTPMPPELHRKLWGVIKPGTWIAWWADGQIAVGPEKLNARKHGWSYRERGITVVCGPASHLAFEKPAGLPWDQSAMQMPTEPPEEGREWWQNVRGNSPMVAQWPTKEVAESRRDSVDTTIHVREVLE